MTHPATPTARTARHGQVGRALLGLLRAPVFLVIAATTASLALVGGPAARLWLLALVAAAPVEDALATGPVSAVSVTKVAGALTFVSFFFFALAQRRRLVIDTIHLTAFALVGIALVSSVAAADTVTATATSLRYASFLGASFVITQFAVEPRFARTIVTVATAGATAAAGLGLLNYFSGETMLVDIHGGDPNDLAFALAVSLPPAVWLAARASAAKRALWVGCVLAMVAALFLTLSRGALLAAAAGLVFYAVTERKLRHLLAAGGIVVALVALVTGTGVQARFESSLAAKSRVAGRNVETRLEAWGGGMRLALDHPLLGVGPGNFPTHYYESTGRPVGTQVFVVHNAYLEIAAELGIPAAVLFTGFLVATFRRLSAARRSPVAPGLATALRTSLVVAAVGAVTLSQQYHLPFWALGGLAAALVSQGEAGRSRHEEGG